ncbi:MAG: dihydroxy-acid dehydratase [Terrimicrobiaceae bacterium]
MTPCNAHFRELTDVVKRGVIPKPGISCRISRHVVGRNVDQAHRQALPQPGQHGCRRVRPRQPVDGVVLLCGCDKTTPSLVMGACSVNIPTIVVSGGAMLTGKYQGRDIGTSDMCHIEYPRGYVHFYQKHVEQAHLGADMDFLKGGSGSEVTRDSH